MSGSLRTRTVLALTAVATAGALGAGPAARAGWTPDVETVAQSAAVGGVRAAAGADGTAVIAWQEGSTIRAAVKPAGAGEFAAPDAIGSGSDPDVAVDDQGLALVVWDAGATIQAAQRAPGASGFAGAGQVLAAQAPNSPRVRFDADGRAVAAALSQPAVILVARPRGAPSFTPFGTAPILGGGDPITAFDVEPARSALVYAAWTTNTPPNHRLFFATFVGGGATSAPPRSLVDAGGTTYNVRAPSIAPATVPVLVGRRSTRAAATAQTALEGFVRPLGPPFPPTVLTLDTANAAAQGPRVDDGTAIVLGDGRVLVTWTRNATPNPAGSVQAARLDPNATSFGAPQQVSAAGETADVSTPAATALAGGGAAVAYAQGGAVRAATAAPGAPFGPREELETGEGLVNAPSLGGDGLGGAVAAWRRGGEATGEVHARLYDEAAPTLADATTPAKLDAGQAGAFAASPVDRWSGATAVWNFGDRTTARGASVRHTYRSGGSYTVSVRAVDGAGNMSPPTERVVVVAGGPNAPPGAGPDATPPRISQVTLTDRVITREGTIIRLTTSERATARFSVQRRVRGFRVRGRCVARRPRGGRVRRCFRYVLVGSFQRQLPGGPATVPFSGRIGGRRLSPGVYRLRVTVTDESGNRSRVATITFRVPRR